MITRTMMKEQLILHRSAKVGGGRAGRDLFQRASRIAMLLLVGCLIGLLVGCGTNGDEAKGTPTNTLSVQPTAIGTPLSDKQEAEEVEALEKPPAATLTNGRAETQAALGSYCWHFDADTTIDCANVFTIFGPTEALHVSPSEKLMITLPDQPLMFVTMRVLEWQAIDSQSSDGQTAIDLDAPLVGSGDLEPLSSIEWEAPPMPGEYMLDLMSVYENNGHIGYGWHIVVE
ncbi:MAG: hypothetical protein ACPGWR_06675 [Ardenticatenaceae bacterium]